MNTLTLKIPVALENALRAASAKRHISKSALVREVLEKTLADELVQGSASAQWVAHWQSAMLVPTKAKSVAPQDARMAQLLAKHLH